MRWCRTRNGRLGSPPIGPICLGILATWACATCSTAGDPSGAAPRNRWRPPSADVVDLEPLFDDLGDPVAIPSFSEPAPASIHADPVAPDFEALRGTAPRTGPVLLYRSPEVAIAVSSTPNGNPVAAVRHHKVSGIDAGTTGIHEVRRGCAVLRSLTEGAYDLWLLDDPSQPVDRPPDRRILIQLRPVELDEHLLQTSLDVALRPNEPKVAGGALVPVAIDEGVRRKLDYAWDLLGRGALYSARQRFLESLDLERVTDTPTANPLSRQVDDLLRGLSKTADATDVAARISRLIGDHGELAEAFHGLAKAHEAMAQEPTSWIREPVQVAMTCYQIAWMLQPCAIDAANDLGLLLVEVGRLQEAADCFRQACDASDAGTFGSFDVERQRAIAALNLGVCLEDMARPTEACRAFRKARTLDPNCAPARIALCRLRMSMQSPALELEELGELFVDLQAIVRQEGEATDSGRWAARALFELRDLAREIDLNRSSFITRRLLPEESKYQTVAIDPTPSQRVPGRSAAHLGDQDSPPEGQ